MVFTTLSPLSQGNPLVLHPGSSGRFLPADGADGREAQQYRAAQHAVDGAHGEYRRRAELSASATQGAVARSAIGMSGIA